MNEGPNNADPDPVGVLRRWQESGAVWRVVARSPGQVTVALLRCDGGEEAERFSTSDEQLRSFLAGRTSSEE